MALVQCTPALITTTKVRWDQQLAGNGDQFSPFGYIETLAIATQDLGPDSYRMAILDDLGEYARTIVSLTYSNKPGYNHIKVLGLRLEPFLDARNPETPNANRLTRHKSRKDLLSRIITSILELSATDDFLSPSVKIYIEKEEYEFYMTFADALTEDFYEKYSINIDTHGNWLTFEQK